MAEKQPIPISVSQPVSPDGGNGSRGIPLPPHEQATLSPEAQERQPLPRVFDVLERGAQLGEIAIARERRKFSRVENKAFDDACRVVVDQLTDEKTGLYTYGTNSDRLILATYSTLTKGRHPKFYPDDSVDLRIGLIPEKDRAFIAKFAPLYGNEDALREELRKAQEENERKRVGLRHREEFSLLPPEEAEQRRREVKRQRKMEKRKKGRETISSEG